VDSELTGSEGQPNAYVTMPDGAALGMIHSISLRPSLLSGQDRSRRSGRTCPSSDRIYRS